MRALILLVYVAMAVWLLSAAALRIAIQLGGGYPLDALPFVSGVLGLLALIVLIPAYEDWRQHADHRRTDRDR